MAQAVTLSLQISHMAAMPAKPVNNAHEHPQPPCHTATPLTRLLSSTSPLRPKALFTSLCYQDRCGTLSSPVVLSTLQTSRTNPSHVGTRANLSMSERKSSAPAPRHGPYPGGEPLPDCVWECCRCRRRWQTKEMGNICIGCSHKYSVECCQLAQ